MSNRRTRCLIASLPLLPTLAGCVGSSLQGIEGTQPFTVPGPVTGNSYRFIPYRVSTKDLRLPDGSPADLPTAVVPVWQVIVTPP